MKLSVLSLQNSETKKIDIEDGKAKYELEGSGDFYGTFAIDFYVNPKLP